MNFKRIKKIGIIVFPDVEELDFVGVYSVLSRINRLNLKKSFKIKIIGTKKRIIWANGLEVISNSVYENLKSFDLLIAPGGIGTRKLLRQRKFITYLKTYPKTKPIASVCTGALLLGKANFLKDKTATTHSLHLDELKLFCKKVVTKRVIQDSNVITSGGITSSLDLGFYLMEKISGEKIKKEIEKIFEFKSRVL